MEVNENDEGCRTEELVKYGNVPNSWNRLRYRKFSISNLDIESCCVSKIWYRLLFCIGNLSAPLRYSQSLRVLVYIKWYITYRGKSYGGFQHSGTFELICSMSSMHFFPVISEPTRSTQTDTGNHTLIDHIWLHFFWCQVVVFCGRMFRIIYQLSSDGLFQFLQIIINLKLLLEIIAQHGLMFLWRDWLG